ncbi:hypothetical protein Q6346_04885 [Isoptericola sp. b490]|uniref:hypothetical protein n=1 Tax=Actinotalea lenta TaxID=3064654 RepID=UPI0027122781|nr:hypothetical protein [Isoptericola sp. b490]MDO8120648.1 hypothetical protein [Isoptericola sp. b490]
MDALTHPAFSRTTAAIADLFGDSLDEEAFAALVDLALAEADRRALADREEGGPTFVVVDGWRVYSDGSRGRGC